MNETAIFGHQTAVAFAAVWLIELLKRSWVPWFSAHSDQLNRFASVLLAMVSAIGLTWCLHGTLATGGTITITFPSGMEMIEAALHFLYQIGIQQGFYNVAVKAKAPS